MSSSDQIPLTICSKQASSRRRSAVLPTFTAILLASLLGIGLAYGACTVLIPAIAQERTGASLPSAGDLSQDVICSGGDTSSGQQVSRAEP